jgi:hypothetical protein
MLLLVCRTCAPSCTPQPCVLSSWSASTACTGSGGKRKRATCAGTRTETRDVLTPASCNGSACSSLRSVRHFLRLCVESANLSFCRGLLIVRTRVPIQQRRRRLQQQQQQQSQRRKTHVKRRQQQHQQQQPKQQQPKQQQPKQQQRRQRQARQAHRQLP